MEERWVRMNGRRFGRSESEKQALCKHMQDEEIKAEIDRVLECLTYQVNKELLPRVFDHMPPIMLSEIIVKRAEMRRECLRKRKLLADYLIGIRMGTL